MNDFKKLIDKYAPPDFSRFTTRLVVIFTIFLVNFLVFVPWIQTSPGAGKVIAYNPSERVQNIHASVSGRIKKWYVREGSKVKKGDPLIEIVDVDPLFMERLNAERNFLQKQLDAARAVTTTSEYDFKRQKELFEKGINSRKDYEMATINYRNAQSAEAMSLSEMIKIDSRISRQSSQLLKAPREGTVVRLVFGDNNLLIKEGDVLCVFVPKTEDKAAEVFIQGRDLPLVYEGREVRLQFEGWPAVQFSGWPSVAIGTFGGVVSMIEQSASHNGMFRVIVVPGKNDRWPESRFVRQGTRVNGWILLNRVSLGYELWRQFNGFPPSMEERPPELTMPTGVQD